MLKKTPPLTKNFLKKDCLPKNSGADRTKKYPHRPRKKLFLKKAGKKISRTRRTPGGKEKIKINKNILDGWGRKKIISKKSRPKNFPNPSHGRVGWVGGIIYVRNIIKKKCVSYFSIRLA